jgi:DNA repair protein RecN (Recombination protein N)
MLIALDVSGVALIDHLSVEFTEKLNILSGETGAGKSILIDAVNLALGGRADRELIRTGEDRARVQALFDVSKNTAAKAFLDEMALETDGGLVAVSREITRSGRSVARIAGQIMPIATVRAFTAHLVDVHGQHEHQSLFDPAAQLGCVDGFDEQTILPLREKTAQAYRQWRAAQRALKEFAGTPQERAQQMDMLAYQIQEIDAAQLQAGEDEQLAQRRLFFKNAQKVADAVSSAKQALESSALDAVLQASRALSAVGAVDARYGDVADQLADSYYTLEDLRSQVVQMADELDYDEREIDRVEDRWELLRRLIRKYGADAQAVLAYRDQAADKLETLRQSDQAVAKMQKRIDQAQAAYEKAARALHDARERTAQAFSNAVLGQLKDLSMGRVQFAVSLGEAAPSALGIDEASFLFSPNAGEPLKPFSKVSSGGELSRMMLAIKTITAQRDGVDTMIFDEIDTGISGRVAMAVGRKMRAIAENRQVLCITHLPQIAVGGQTHFLIEKSEREGRTVTQLTPLSGQARVAEIARLSGGTQSESALAHAREMLLEAQGALEK